MKILQNFILRHSFSALILLIAIYGCKNTNNITTPKPSASDLKPDPAQANAENAKPGIPLSSPAEKDEDATATYKQSESDRKQHIETFMKEFGSLLAGHGRGPENAPKERNTTTTKKSTEDLTAKSDDIENRHFIDLEKKLYGKWINKKETESYEFHDDGTVQINVTDQRGMSRKLNGNYKLVEEERIKIDFKGDSFVGQMPPRYFKISISANEFTLTDEPNLPDGPDGAATKYKRIK